MATSKAYPIHIQTFKPEKDITGWVGYRQKRESGSSEIANEIIQWSNANPDLAVITAITRMGSDALRVTRIYLKNEEARLYTELTWGNNLIRIGDKSTSSKGPR